MFCVKCGNKLRDDEIICERCGFDNRDYMPHLNNNSKQTSGAYGDGDEISPDDEETINLRASDMPGNMKSDDETQMITSADAPVKQSDKQIDKEDNSDKDSKDKAKESDSDTGDLIRNAVANMNKNSADKEVGESKTDSSDAATEVKDTVEAVESNDISTGVAVNTSNIDNNTSSLNGIGNTGSINNSNTVSSFGNSGRTSKPGFVMDDKKKILIGAAAAILVLIIVIALTSGNSDDNKREKELVANITSEMMKSEASSESSATTESKITETSTSAIPKDKIEVIEIKHIEPAEATLTKAGRIECWFDRTNKIYYTNEERTEVIKKEDTFIYPFDPSKKGLQKYSEDGKLYFAKNGVKHKKYYGFARYKSNWYYVFAGAVDYEKNGLVKAPIDGKEAYWYVEKGKLAKKTTVAQNKNGWWLVKKGKVVFEDGVAKNSDGVWYCKAGKVAFDFTGTVEVDGKTYDVEKGKVISGYEE